MMAQAMIGSLRSEAAGPPVDSLVGSTKTPALLADFEVILQQSAGTGTSTAKSPQAKKEDDSLTLVHRLQAPVGGIAHVKHAVGVNQAPELAKDGDPEVVSVAASDASFVKTSNLGDADGLQAEPLTKDLSPIKQLPLTKQSGNPSLAVTIAGTSSPSHVLDPVPGQKASSETATSSAVKHSKRIAKPVSLIVIVPATPLVTDGGTPPSLPEGALPSVVPAGQQSVIALAPEKPSLKTAPALHVGMVAASSIGVSAPAGQRNEPAPRPDAPSIDPAKGTHASASTVPDRTSVALIVSPTAVSVDASGTLPGSSGLPTSLHLEARTFSSPENKSVVALLGQHESVLDVPGAGHAQEGGLPHTLLIATPTTLEVGVSGGSHGWLKIRAELTRTGEVTASLGGASPGAASVLRSELPALNSYLQAEKIQVGALSVHTMLPAMNDISDNSQKLSYGGLSDVSGGLNGGTANGHTPHEGGQQAAASLNAGEDAGDLQLNRRPATGIYASGIGLGGGGALSLVEYGADGSWLNVRV